MEKKTPQVCVKFERERVAWWNMLVGIRRTISTRHPKCNITSNKHILYPKNRCISFVVVHILSGLNYLLSNNYQFIVGDKHPHLYESPSHSIPILHQPKPRLKLRQNITHISNQFWLSLDNIQSIAKTILINKWNKWLPKCQHYFNKNKFNDIEDHQNIPLNNEN